MLPTSSYLLLIIQFSMYVPNLILFGSVLILFGSVPNMGQHSKGPGDIVQFFKILPLINHLLADYYQIVSIAWGHFEWIFTACMVSQPYIYIQLQAFKISIISKVQSYISM